MKRAALILEYLGDGLLLGGLGEHATGHHSQWFTALAVVGRICSRLGRVFREIVQEDYENVETKKNRLPVPP